MDRRTSWSVSIRPIHHRKTHGKPNSVKTGQGRASETSFRLDNLTCQPSVALRCSAILRCTVRGDQGGASPPRSENHRDRVSGRSHYHIVLNSKIGSEMRDLSRPLLLFSHRFLPFFCRTHVHPPWILMALFARCFTHTQRLFLAGFIQKSRRNCPRRRGEIYSR